MKSSPVPCTLCGKGWRDKQSLSKHIENAHRDAAISNLTKGNSDLVEIIDDDDAFQHQLIKSLDFAKRPEQSNFQNVVKNRQNMSRKQQSVTRTEQVKNLPTQPFTAKSNTDKISEPEICIVKSSGLKQIRGVVPSACWNCTQCDARLLTKAGLEQHIKKEHAIVEAPLICSSCKAQFSGHSNFLNHLPNCRKPQAASSNLLMCAFCQKKFTSKADFTKHLSSDHPEVADLKTSKMPPSMTVQMMCGQCSNRFSTRRELEKHLDETHAKPCAHCQLMFRDPPAYQVSSQVENRKMVWIISGSFDVFAHVHLLWLLWGWRGARGAQKGVLTFDHFFKNKKNIKCGQPPKYSKQQTNQ